MPMGDHRDEVDVKNSYYSCENIVSEFTVATVESDLTKMTSTHLSAPVETI